jgi:hypothetical protein
MTNDDRQIRRVLAKNVLATSSRDGTAVARFFQANTEGRRMQRESQRMITPIKSQRLKPPSAQGRVKRDQEKRKAAKAMPCAL